jgi:TonB family protein
VTAVALAHRYDSIPDVQGAGSLYPVPRGRKADDSKIIFRRSAIASIALHLAVVAVALAIQYWPSTALVGTPQDQILDVTIIPLSAFDTILPKGASAVKDVPPEVPKEEKAVEPTARKMDKDLQPKKIIAAKSLASVRPERMNPKVQDKSQANETSDSLLVGQQIGVANGEAASIEQARISYQDMVATLLARAKRYPERALKRRMTGEGTIRIEISANGSLSGFQIIQSTATSILDEELRAMVERASPFPAFPADLRKGSLALVVPVAFRLEG